MTDKKALRSELIAARDGIPAELHAELSAAVCRNILSMPEYAACDTLLGYCPIGSEWVSARCFATRRRADAG